MTYQVYSIFLITQQTLPCSVNILLLSLWTAIAPLSWTREIDSYNEFNQATESHGTCWALDSNTGAQVAFLVAIGVVNVGILLMSLHQAYKARHIHLEFAESEYISKALSTSLLVCLVGIPVMILVTNDKSTSFFVLAR